MYVVVNHLHFSKPVDEFQAAVQQEALPLLARLPGFEDFYFVKVADDRAIVILVWRDAASADGGAKAFGPTWFAKNFAPFLASEQQRSGGDVIAHHQK
jgi:heme-degrading monooxygenase HmoA